MSSQKMQKVSHLFHEMKVDGGASCIFFREGAIWRMYTKTSYYVQSGSIVKHWLHKINENWGDSGSKKYKNIVFFT